MMPRFKTVLKHRSGDAILRKWNVKKVGLRERAASSSPSVKHGWMYRKTASGGFLHWVLLYDVERFKEGCDD
jgi:hypothetical protein